MSQAPFTSDKPMFYFALFPFISKPVIILHLTTRCAALCAEEWRDAYFAGQPWITASRQRALRSRRGDARGRILPATLAAEPSLLSPRLGHVPFNLAQRWRWVFSP